MVQGKALLKVIAGEDQGKGWELDEHQSYTLGRSRGCNLRLVDPSVSGAHARLECRQGIWIITDLDSTHGTKVNKQRILAPKPLFDRDVIRVGATTVEFRQYERLSDVDLGRIDGGVRLPGQ